MPFMSVAEPRTAPPRLTGKIKTRAEARQIYAGIVDELEACDDKETLEIYLMTIGEEIIQFREELDFLWTGDGADFVGLDREIKAAFDKFATYY